MLRAKHEADGACYDVADNLICPINYHTDKAYLEIIYCGKRAANFICINFFYLPNPSSRTMALQHK
jgi:hypothetical protein